MRNAAPAALIRCLARLMRCAIVASGTRNARAISAVVRPPTARSVSASCDGARQRRMAAQRQQRERVVLLRRRAARRAPARAPRRAARAPRPRLAAPARVVAAELVGQAARRDRDQPAARVLGHALRGPLTRGGQQRLLHGVLAGVEVPVAAHERAEDLRRQPAQQVLDAGVGALTSPRPGLSMSGRTSIAQSRDAGIAARDLGRALGALDVDDVVAGQLLLGLGERAVGDRRDAVADAHGLGVVGIGERRAADELARLVELLVERARTRPSARRAPPRAAPRRRRGSGRSAGRTSRRRSFRWVSKGDVGAGRAVLDIDSHVENALPVSTTSYEHHHRQPLARAVCALRGHADDHPRHDDRERRAAVDPGRSRLLAGRASRGSSTPT